MTQDAGVHQSDEEELPVIEESTESTQDGVEPVIEASTETTQDAGVHQSDKEELPVIEESTELTQDGVNMNQSNEEKSPVAKNTNIDTKEFFPSADADEDSDAVVLNTHDASFQMDELDTQLMQLDLNLSKNLKSSVTQVNSTEVYVIDSSSDEFLGFDCTDIASTSDTEATDSSIIISDDDDDDDSTSNTTARVEFMENDENVSNFSSVVPPSVAKSDDETVPFSDGDGMSEEIQIKNVGNAVSPCQGDSTDDLSEDEIENKLLLIRQFPNQIKENRASYYCSQRVGNYPSCFRNKIHCMAEVHQKPVEKNDYEKEAGNSENDSINGDVEAKIPQGQPDEKEAGKIENDSGDNDHVEPYEKEAENNENQSINGDVETNIPQGQPDEEEAENNENQSINGDVETEIPQGQPDEEEAENNENQSINGDVETNIPQGQPDEEEAENNENQSINGDVETEILQGQPDEEEAENSENQSINGDVESEFPQGQPDEEERDDSHNISDDNVHLELDLKNKSVHENDDDKEMENKNDLPETPITNLDPEDELLNPKHNITRKRGKQEKKRKLQRLAAKRKTTKNIEKPERKRKSKRLEDKNNKKIKKEEMSDEVNKVYKLPKQILREHQQSKVMTETDQKTPIMQAIYKRNLVPSNEDGTRSECTLCKKTFAHKRSLNTHLKAHYQTGKFNCSFCGCNFVN